MIVDKIAKLLALAESPNEHEAKAAMLKARALMAANKLSEKDIQSKTKSKKLIRRTIGITFTELSTPWVLTIAQAVARHYCCAAYQSAVKDAKKNNKQIENWLITYGRSRACCKKSAATACQRRRATNMR